MKTLQIASSVMVYDGKNTPIRLDIQELYAVTARRDLWENVVKKIDGMLDAAGLRHGMSPSGEYLTYHVVDVVVMSDHNYAIKVAGTYENMYYDLDIYGYYYWPLVDIH